MSEPDQEVSVEERSRKLRFVAAIGLAGDVVIAGVLILLRDMFPSQSFAFVIASVLVASGIALFIVLPRLPAMTARSQEHGRDSDSKRT